MPVRKKKKILTPGLSERSLDRDPFVQFRAWYRDAEAAGLRAPETMALATSTPEGKPSVRMVLLKGIADGGFIFFTNYDSRKGKQLRDNPIAAVVFHWRELERQVRIEGRVEKISSKESDAYFASRSRESQISARISPQSEVITDRRDLEQRVAEEGRRYAGRSIPRPGFWGGYRIIPDMFEFWQGREARLHDRFLYVRDSDGRWKISRLAP